MKIPLQSNEWEYPDSLDAFVQELLGVFTRVAPLEVIATLVFGTIAIAAYIRQDSPIIALGFVMLTGAAVMPLMAPIGIQAAVVGVLLFGAGVMMLAWYIYSD